MNISFTPDGWRDYLYWQTQDKKTLKRINDLLQALARGDGESIGKPELLTSNMAGWHSLRIDKKNRLIYRNAKMAKSKYPNVATTTMIHDLKTIYRMSARSRKLGRAFCTQGGRVQWHMSSRASVPARCASGHPIPP